MMKKYKLATFAILFAPLLLSAQQSDITGAAKKTMSEPKFDTAKKWDIGGPISISFTQTSFNDWAAGGDGSTGLTGLASLHANYVDSNFSWLNDLELGYGFTKLDGEPTQKTTDQIEATSSVGYKVFDHISLTLLGNFQSQFSPGYTNIADTQLLSKFMAPGYLIASLGLNYKPNKDLSVFLSPASGRFVFVEDQALANLGDDGVKKAVYSETGQLITPGQEELTEFGAYLKADYNHSFNKMITLTTNLELFSNYLKDPQDIVVNFSGLLQIKVSKYIAVTFNAQMIYDNSINIPILKNVGGVNTEVSDGPRLQLKDVLGIGLGFKI